MKSRRHHNNKGLRQIKNGATRKYIKRLADKLGITYKDARQKGGSTDSDVQERP